MVCLRRFAQAIFSILREIKDLRQNLLNVSQKYLRSPPGCCQGDLYDDMHKNITASAPTFNLSVKVMPEVGEGFAFKVFHFKIRSLK